MSSVTDIARRRADRLRVMNAIYEAAEGSRMSHVSGGWLLEHLELSDEELGGICRYLEDEHLITAGREYWGHHTPFMILLTHAGIEEMKRSRAAPDQATEHFPPISVLHIEGDAIGSAVQPGSPRAHEAVSIGDLNLDTVREIVGEFEAQAASRRHQAASRGHGGGQGSDRPAHAGSPHHRRAPSIGACDPRTRHQPNGGGRPA